MLYLSIISLQPECTNTIQYTLVSTDTDKANTFTYIRLIRELYVNHSGSAFDKIEISVANGG